MNKYEKYAVKKYAENKVKANKVITLSALVNLAKQQDQLYKVMWRRFDSRYMRP